ncbi:MAG: septum formation initiator family protein [Henriciella sp.]|nr:septum formation initiator family protein [Henriciella sp.]
MSKRAFFFGLAVIAVLIFSLYRAKFGARETVAQIAEVDAQIEIALAEQTELLAEFSHRSRQEWIEDYARTQLGMVPARAEQFVRIVDLDGQIGPPVELEDQNAARDREGGDAGN